MAKDPERLGEADLLYRQAIAMRNDYVQVSFATIICHNDELSLTWIDCFTLLSDSEVFILFAEIAKSFSKFILFPTFMYLVSSIDLI